MKRRGFSLLEMLVVIAIIAILASLLLPSLSKAKGRAKQIPCLGNLRQIGVASMAYAASTDDRIGGRLSRANRFASPFQAAMEELKSPKIFVCPADAERLAATNSRALNQTNTSYFSSISANLKEPASILAGDRNFTYAPASGPNAGVHALQTGSVRLMKTNQFGWWRNIHIGKGNILLADASAHTTDPKKLMRAVAAHRAPSVWWVVPNGAIVRTPPTR